MSVLHTETSCARKKQLSPQLSLGQKGGSLPLLFLQKGIVNLLQGFFGCVYSIEHFKYLSQSAQIDSSLGSDVATHVFFIFLVKAFNFKLEFPTNFSYSHIKE